MLYSGLILDIDEMTYNDNNEFKFIDNGTTINSLLERKIPVVIYTEKDEKYAERIMESLNVVEPAIVMNGAKIYSPFEKWYNFDFYLSVKDIKELCTWARERKVTTELITDKGIIKYERWSMEVEKCVLDGEFQELPKVLQFVFNTSGSCFRWEVLKLISSKQMDCYSYICENKVVCVSSAADKGKAMKYLADKKKWDLKSFVAIGNFPKDYSLFEKVGLGISVSGYINVSSLDVLNTEQDYKKDILRNCVKNYF